MGREVKSPKKCKFHFFCVRKADFIEKQGFRQQLNAKMAKMPLLVIFGRNAGTDGIYKGGVLKFLSFGAEIPSKYYVMRKNTDRLRFLWKLFSRHRCIFETLSEYILNN